MQLLEPRLPSTSSTDGADSPHTGGNGAEKRPTCTTLSPEGSSFLAPVTEGLQVHGGGLSEGRVGGEFPGPAELGPGFVTPSLTHQHEAQDVVGALQLRFQTGREPEGFLGFRVPAEVVECPAEIVLRHVGAG